MIRSTKKQRPVFPDPLDRMSRVGRSCVGLWLPTLGITSPRNLIDLSGKGGYAAQATVTLVPLQIGSSLTGGGLYFDGGDVLVIPHRTELSMNAGFGTAWAIFETTVALAGNETIFGKTRDITSSGERSWGLYFVNSTRLGARVDNGAGTTLSLQTDATFSYGAAAGIRFLVAMTLDGTTFTLHALRDGDLYETASTAQTVNPQIYSTFGVGIGASANQDRRFVTGNILGCGIHNEPLGRIDLERIWKAPFSLLRRPSAASIADQAAASRLLHLRRRNVLA